MKKVIVRTELYQELMVPESWDRYDVFDFLAEHESFRTAFQGVSNEGLSMSKMAELAYDIEQLYIEGYSPKSIAAIKIFAAQW